MKRRQILRRSGLLCCHCLRNLAFYKSGWRNGALIFNEPFWVNANGNFLDICVLEWCKLFADVSGKHHWRKVITDQIGFFEALLKTAILTEAEFDAYIGEMRTYRDKFIAHLDAEEIMYPPNLSSARKTVSFFYDYLLTNEEIDACFHDAPTNASDFYELIAKQGEKIYST